MKRSRPIEDTQRMAMYVASVVRNAMEDFHDKTFSDENMKKLNVVIRNAIYTALYASENYGDSDAAKLFVTFNSLMIPDYWEKPELLEDFLGVEKFAQRGSNE